MIIRMIVIALPVLLLASIPSLLLTGGTSLPIAKPAYIQQPQSANTPKAVRILMEEDFSAAQMVRRELTVWSDKKSIPIIYVKSNLEPYDLRILLASDVGSDSGTCSPAFSDAISTCSVTVSVHFVSAVALTPESKLQFTETGVGGTKKYAITNLAEKLARRISILSYPRKEGAE